MFTQIINLICQGPDVTPGYFQGMYDFIVV